MPFRILEQHARSILSPTTGFIAEAGFTHSLTPARNCTYGCSYCYVPTMRVFGGLKQEDWKRWGEFSTFKSNAADLLRREIRGDEVIYCSPVVDPWQPVERIRTLMPEILAALLERPPRLLVLQTRGTGILDDLQLLRALARRTDVRVSFSITTDNDGVRRRYETRCAPFAERLEVVRTLIAAGIRTFVTLAPILPCNPEALAEAALAATVEDLVGDPFHTPENKPKGAGTRVEALQIARRYDELDWFNREFQNGIVERIRRVAERHGRRFGIGPEGFSWLSRISQ